MYCFDKKLFNTFG